MMFCDRFVGGSECRAGREKLNVCRNEKKKRRVRGSERIIEEGGEGTQREGGRGRQ